MGKVTGARGSYAKTKGRRRAITEATLALVMEKGHRSVTTSEVAERAGLSEPGVLYHFSSKDELLLAALQLFDELEWSSLPTGESIQQAPVRAAEGVKRTNIVRLHAAMYSEATDPGHPAHEYFKERMRRGDELMAESIRRLQAAGAADSGIDPLRASRWIHAAWEGLQLQWLADPNFDMEDELQRLIEVVLATPLEPTHWGRTHAKAASS